jgi:hypothetical protein
MREIQGTSIGGVVLSRTLGDPGYLREPVKYRSRALGNHVTNCFSESSLRVSLPPCEIRTRFSLTSDPAITWARARSRWLSGSASRPIPAVEVPAAAWCTSSFPTPVMASHGRSPKSKTAAGRCSMPGVVRHSSRPACRELRSSALRRKGCSCSTDRASET